jgi:Flp pilus assembly protein TadG
MHTLDPIDSLSSGREEGLSKPKACKASRATVERGSAILEAGLLLPVLLLMTCGAMDFARVFFAGIVVESAARAAAQAGSFSVGKADTTNTQTAGQNDAANQGLTGVNVSSRIFCGCVDSTAEISCGSASTCSGATPDSYSETTATYTFNPIVPYPGIPQNIVVTGKACFRVQ